MVPHGQRAVQVQASTLSAQYMGPLPAGVSGKVIRYPHASLAQEVFDLKLVSSGYDLVARSTGGDVATDQLRFLHESHYPYHRPPGSSRVTG